MTQCPVVVIGAGPVGLALAGDLGWRGVPCLVIERSTGRITQPRMDLVGVRTMEFARRWGIVEDVEHSPYPRDYPQDNVYVSSLNGVEFEREPMPGLDAAPFPSQSPQRRERCPQDMFDPILRRFAESQPGVELRYHTEFVGYEETAAGVRVDLHDRRSGTGYSVSARYLVACDGGDSRVREQAGITRSGAPVLTYTTNVIFRCAELPQLHDKRPGYRFICIGPEGTYATIVAIDGADRWRLSIVGDQSPDRPDDAAIDAVIRRVVGRDLDYELLSTMHWTRSELVADRYDSGSVFLAGDSAHVMSPTGGFGMNTGIGDAVDLSWKLEAALAGWAGRGLLSSYSAERRPVAVRNAAEATANLRNMLSPRSDPPAPAAFEPGPAGDAARATFGARYKALMGREWFSIGIHLGYRYVGSPVCWADDGEAASTLAPTRPRDYVQTAAPGARAPHVWLADGRSTLDLFGRTFVLLRLGDKPAPCANLSHAASERGMPLAVVDIAEPAVAQAYGRRLVLVRPDGHVAWRGNQDPERAEDVVAVVTGHADRHALQPETSVPVPAVAR